MSANDATGGEKENPNFDSPNISGAVEEEQAEKKAAEEQRRKEETVEIDGVPIEEKDQKYKTKDILKKEKTEYFVKIEGAEERARAASQAKDEMAAYLDVTAEEEYKKTVRDTKKKEKKANRAQSRKKIKDKLWKGPRKILTILVIIMVLAGIGYGTYWLTIIRPVQIAEEEKQKAIDDGIDMINSLNMAREIYLSGDIAAGDAEVERLIASTDDPKLKADCYSFRSRIYLQLGDAYIDDAISDAEAAEGLVGTYETAVELYELGKRFNRQDLVDKYYQIAVERAEQRDSGDDGDDDYVGEG